MVRARSSRSMGLGSASDQFFSSSRPVIAKRPTTAQKPYRIGKPFSQFVRSERAAACGVHSTLPTFLPSGAASRRCLHVEPHRRRSSATSCQTRVREDDQGRRPRLPRRAGSTSALVLSSSATGDSTTTSLVMSGVSTWHTRKIPLGAPHPASRCQVCVEK